MHFKAYLMLTKTNAYLVCSWAITKMVNTFLIIIGMLIFWKLIDISIEDKANNIDVLLWRHSQSNRLNEWQEEKYCSSARDTCLWQSWFIFLYALINVMLDLKNRLKIRLATLKIRKQEYKHITLTALHVHDCSPDAIALLWSGKNTLLFPLTLQCQ